MDNFELGREIKHTQAVAAQAAASIGNGKFISMAKLNKLEVLVQLEYGADVDCEITFIAADNVNGDNPVVMTALFQLKVNTDTALTDALPRIVAPAASYTIDTGAGKSQKVCFTIYPAQMPIGKPAICVNIGGSDALNFVSSDYFAVPKYQDESLLTN